MNFRIFSCISGLYPLEVIKIIIKFTFTSESKHSMLSFCYNKFSKKKLLQFPLDGFCHSFLNFQNLCEVLTTAILIKSPLKWQKPSFPTPTKMPISLKLHKSGNQANSVMMTNIPYILFILLNDFALEQTYLNSQDKLGTSKSDLIKPQSILENT